MAARYAVGWLNPVTVCDLGIFTDQAAEPVSLQHPDIRPYSGRTRASSGRVLIQRPVRALRVVMVYVLAEDPPQVQFAGSFEPLLQWPVCAPGKPVHNFERRGSDNEDNQCVSRAAPVQ